MFDDSIKILINEAEVAEAMAVEAFAEYAALRAEDPVEWDQWSSNTTILAQMVTSRVDLEARVLRRVRVHARRAARIRKQILRAQKKIRHKAVLIENKMVSPNLGQHILEMDEKSPAESTSWDEVIAGDSNRAALNGPLGEDGFPKDPVEGQTFLKRV